MTAPAATTPWFLIDVDGQPPGPGWYDVLYEGQDEEQLDTRLYWDGAVWRVHPRIADAACFGNFDTTGERWRGAATPIGGMYV